MTTVGKPKRHRCTACGVLDDPDNLVFDSDPYLHDIEGDPTPRWMHPACRQERADDI